MATTELFNNMIKEYMPYDLLVEEFKRHNYFWNKIKKDAGWNGGTLYVPFEGGEFNSLSYGALTASASIGSATEVKGSISAHKELWASMKFYEKDLDAQGDMKKNFLRLLPDKVEQMVQRMTAQLSVNVMNGAHTSKAVADGTAGGLIYVDHPERHTIGENVYIDDDNSAATNGFIVAINMNHASGGELHIQDARSAGANVDLSGYTAAQNAKVYCVGAQASSFTSLRDSLLSSANGGSATLYGQTKTAYPFLQSKQISGAAITATNIMDAIFDAYSDTRAWGKGNPSEVIMSYKNFKNCIKALQTSKQYAGGEAKAGYGFNSIDVMGLGGAMTLTAIRDMDDDVIYIIDWASMKFFGSNFFDRKRHLDGNEFFLERATTGYSYIVDIRLFGDFILHRPSNNGVIHSINY